ncbi:MAG: hypothetical protein ABIL09_14315 [Gemmatimonadota bacterium]
MIVVEWFGCRLVAGDNAREHWGSRVARARKQRAAAKLWVANAFAGSGPPRPPYRVTIIRYGRRHLDDDNLAGSAKHIRDGVADALGVNDGDKRKVRWFYGDEIRKRYGVRIEIEGG